MCVYYMCILYMYTHTHTHTHTDIWKRGVKAVTRSATGEHNYENYRTLSMPEKGEEVRVNACACM